MLKSLTIGPIDHSNAVMYFTIFICGYYYYYYYYVVVVVVVVVVNNNNNNNNNNNIERVMYSPRYN